MDGFLVDVNMDVLKQWVLNQNREGLIISLDSKDPDYVHIDSSNARGLVTFNDHNIIELQVVNANNSEPVFYLHFQLNTLSHAMELFEEMVDSIYKIDKEPLIKVMLCCTSGITTSYFAQQIKQGLELLKIKAQLDATSYNNLFSKGEDYDIILLAPQVAYMLSQVEEVFDDKKVMVVNAQDYAKYDVASIINIIQNTNIKKKQKEKAIITSKIKLSCNILSLVVIRNSQRIHIICRLYGVNNDIIVENEIIKNKISIKDIYDAIDTIVARNTVDKISITIPGIHNDGLITSTSINGLDTVNCAYIDDKYPQDVYFYNDVNAGVAGYYASQDKYQTISLLFQPVNYSAGVGSVINGQLYRGRKNISGEVQYTPLDLSNERQVLNKTPEGMIELVSKISLSLTSTIAPEMIVIISVLLKDPQDIVEYMSNFIPEEYIPEIVIVENLHDYCLLGQTILCDNEVQ